MHPKTYLDSQVFEKEIQFKTLENILETLDHITPVNISRVEYEAKNGEILQKTGENKFGEIYNLYIPEDLAFGELLYYIDFLNAKFNIKNTEKYQNIIIQAKIFIKTILTNLGEEKGSEYLQELKEKYKISDDSDFIKELKINKLGYSVRRNVVEIIEKRPKKAIKSFEKIQKM